jgi:lysophospholipase L1-like esterase
MNTTTQTRRVHLATFMNLSRPEEGPYADVLLSASREELKEFLAAHPRENITFIENIIGAPEDPSKPWAVHVVAWPESDGVHVSAKAYSSRAASLAEFPEAGNDGTVLITTPVREHGVS